MDDKIINRFYQYRESNNHRLKDKNSFVDDPQPNKSDSKEDSIDGLDEKVDVKPAENIKSYNTSKASFMSV